MADENSILKIPEVRELLKNHKRDALEFLVVELYKMLNKSQKVDNSVAALIRKPEPGKANAKTKATVKLRSIKEIESQADFFIDNAYAQNYLAPNRSVSKKDRPKWRFVAKALYKDLNMYVDQDEQLPKVAEIFEKLYNMLCYSCGYQLFTAYDTFESVGVTQGNFFNATLRALYKVMDKPSFIDKSIRIIINNELNRYTLYESLMNIFLEYMQTNDMRALVVSRCDIFREELLNTPAKKSSFSYYDPQKSKILLTAILGFKCYMAMFETDEAIAYFRKFHTGKEPEVNVYILVNLLRSHNDKDAVLRVINEAEKNNIKLRPGLIECKNYIISNNALPKYI